MMKTLEKPSIDWAALPAVEAEIGYIPRAKGRRIALDFSEGYRPPVELIPTSIHDAGAVRDQLSLDREGFVLLPLEAAGDHGDGAWIKQIWQPAVEALIRRISGAPYAVSWGFNMRFSSRSPESARTPVSRPAANVHSDFGPNQFGRIVDHAEANAAIAAAMDGRRPTRWRCFNIWQAISPTPLDSALALCDSSSVSPGDICIADTRLNMPDGATFSIELCQYRYNAAQHWCYFRDIRQDEVLVFSGLDPVAAKPWRVVPHTAFDDPTCPPGTPPRNSVEIRAIALFDSEG